MFNIKTAAVNLNLWSEDFHKRTRGIPWLCDRRLQEIILFSRYPEEIKDSFPMQQRILSHILLPASSLVKLDIPQIISTYSQLIYKKKTIFTCATSWITPVCLHKWACFREKWQQKIIFALKKGCNSKLFTCFTTSIVFKQNPISNPACWFSAQMAKTFNCSTERLSRLNHFQLQHSIAIIAVWSKATLFMLCTLTLFRIFYIVFINNAKESKRGKQLLQCITAQIYCKYQTIIRFFPPRSALKCCNCILLSTY